MTATAALLAFTLAAAILTITPGLDTALVLRTAAVEGGRRALMAGLGICAGCLLWGAIAAFGLGSLLAVSSLAYDTLRICAAVYLFYLGAKLLWRTLPGRSPGPHATASDPVPRGAPAATSATGWFLRGCLTNALNPKRCADLQPITGGHPRAPGRALVRPSRRRHPPTGKMAVPPRRDARFGPYDRCRVHCVWIEAGAGEALTQEMVGTVGGSRKAVFVNHDRQALPRSTHPTIDDQFVRGTTHRRIPSPASHLDGWRAGGLRALTHRLASSRVSLRVWVQGCGSCSVGWVKCVRVGASTRASAARNPSSMHATMMDCAQAVIAPTTHDAYANCSRPRGGNSAGPAALLVGAVSVTARNLDAPEGIRREPKADEDDDGGVRSEGSGPQSWARVAMTLTPTGNLRSTIPSKKNHAPHLNRPMAANTHHDPECDPHRKQRRPPVTHERQRHAADRQDPCHHPDVDALIDEQHHRQRPRQQAAELRRCARCDRQAACHHQAVQHQDCDTAVHA
ncbi:hypothetical protein G6F59_012623 [Rhizopus arrhizus]|nr:hypothetical protein G6F59_012623 [Rhizopus arrhizus]